MRLSICMGKKSQGRDYEPRRDCSLHCASRLIQIPRGFRCSRSFTVESQGRDYEPRSEQSSSLLQIPRVRLFVLTVVRTNEPGEGFEPSNSRLQVGCLNHPSSPGAVRTCRCPFECVSFSVHAGGCTKLKNSQPPVSAISPSRHGRHRSRGGGRTGEQPRFRPSHRAR